MMRVVRAPLLRGEGKCVDLGILLLLFPVLPAFVRTHFFFFQLLFGREAKYLDKICICIDCPSFKHISFMTLSLLLQWNDRFLG